MPRFSQTLVSLSQMEPSSLSRRTINMKSPCILLILALIINIQVNAAFTSNKRIHHSVRGNQKKYEHKHEINMSPPQEPKSSLEEKKSLNTEIIESGHSASENTNQYNSNLNAYININVSMNIGGRSWSFHDTRSSVAPDIALKTVVSLLSKEDKEDLEQNISRGMFEMRRLLNDETVNMIDEKPLNSEETPIISEKMERPVLKANPDNQLERPVFEQIQVDYGRSVLECNETQKNIQIRILVASDTDGLSWILSTGVGSAESPILEGGEYYMYDGDQTWYTANTCIDLEECYTFSITSDTQNNTYRSYEILLDNEMYHSNVGMPGTQVVIGCNGDDDFFEDDDSILSTADEERKAKCDLNPILAPLNRINPTNFNSRTSKLLSIITAISGREAFTDSSSPEYRAGCWIIYDDPHKVSTTDISIIQRYVLAVLYYTTNGNFWSNKYKFLTTEDECNWNTNNNNEWGMLGVQCTEGKVSKINLVNNNLKGYIPSEISKLQGLVSLILGNNNLEGTIPKQLGGVSNLTSLVLTNNVIEGEIPEQLYHASNLEVLDIANNSLTGLISPHIGNLTTLSTLTISNNLFSGTVPEEMFDLENLNLLQIDQNNFTGTISTNILRLFYLKSLDMSQNNLSGTIPSEIGNIPLLSLNLEGNVLTGVIPNEITNMLDLRKMILSNNNLIGTIPNAVHMMKRLTAMDMSNNSLSGNLPLFPEQLQTLRLNHNLLEGTIPVTLGNLSKLFKLRLEANNLTGKVPQIICRHFNSDPGSIYGYETILTTDCAHQFLPPKVNCTCCTWCTGRFSSYDRIGNCPGGEIRVDINYKRSDWHRMSWFIRDRSGETIFDEGPLVSIPKKTSYKACITLTGCFFFKNYNPTGYTYMDRKIYIDDKLLDESDSTEIAFGYDSSIESLSVDKCDEVAVNGKNLSKDGRKIFNEMAKSSGLSTLRDPTTSQYKAAQWTLKDAESQDQDRSFLQRYILSLLYYNNDGDNWINSAGYLTEEHECKWYGITCDKKYMNVVRAINLSSNNLGGTLLNEIGELSALEHFDLSYNKNLTGDIPNDFANLWSLNELILANNRLNGTFPESLRMMKNVKKLEMNDNKLHGNLPALVDMVSLETLNLANNYLDGVIADRGLPNKSLAHLNLGSNLFNGPFPMSIVHALNLRELILSHNEFTSSIPSFIGNLQHLVRLSLDQNRIRGTIPTSVSNMTKLIELALHSNDLTGTIPSEIGSLTQLMKLTVSYNSLKGGIPRETANLANLSLLHLQGNLLTGDTGWMQNCDSWNEDRSFIADCGEPSEVLNQLSCPCCTECCNVFKLCQTNDLREFSPLEVALICMGAICAIVFFICAILIKIVAKKKMKMKFVDLDVVKASGDDSVYCFVFTKSVTCWIVTVLTVLLQVFLFILFLIAASFQFDDSDWVYTKRCPANSLECQDERRISEYAWVVFGIFLLICLLPDLANGFKLTYKATSSGCYRCLISGIILIFVTSLAALTSFFYNYAIAMSNTEMIINAAVLLFVNDMDERVFLVLTTLFPRWMEKRSDETNRMASALQQRSRASLGMLPRSLSSLRLQKRFRDQDDSVDQLRERVDALEKRCISLLRYGKGSSRFTVFSEESGDAGNGDIHEDLIESAVSVETTVNSP